MYLGRAHALASICTILRCLRKFLLAPIFGVFRIINIELYNQIRILEDIYKKISLCCRINGPSSKGYIDRDKDRDRDKYNGVRLELKYLVAIYM